MPAHPRPAQSGFRPDGPKQHKGPDIAKVFYRVSAVRHLRRVLSGAGRRAEDADDPSDDRHPRLDRRRKGSGPASDRRRRRKHQARPLDRLRRPHAGGVYGDDGRRRVHDEGADRRGMRRLCARQPRFRLWRGDARETARHFPGDRAGGEHEIERVPDEDLRVEDVRAPGREDRGDRHRAAVPRAVDRAGTPDRAGTGIAGRRARTRHRT